MQLFSLPSLSAVLSFHSTEITLHIDSNLELFSALLISFTPFLVSGNKHSKFGANLFIRSRAKIERKYISKISVIYMSLFRRSSVSNS
jgi:acyl-[acyl carrier protein]--UDP-N-acetylglucosamine O-acyltransferase